MQPTSLTGRQQQLGLLMGRAQPDMLEAARVAAILNGQSGSFSLQSGLGGAGLGSGVLAGLGSTPGGLNLNLGSLQQASQQAPQNSQLALPDQLALLSQFPHALLPPPQYSSTDRDLQLTGLRNVGKTRSSDSRSSSAYASRHQAAEQRRRTRINERLELLRKLVPHAERANTACFLEEVIKYIESLKRRTLELEAMLEAATGKPVAKSLGTQGILGGAGSAGVLGALESDSQAPSPRQVTPPSQQLSGPHPPSGGGAGGTATAAASTGALSLPAPSSLPSQQSSQQQQQQQQAASQQQALVEALAAAPQVAAASHHQQSPQLQLASAISSQLAHLIPGMGGSQGQQSGLGTLFPHSGGALSISGGQLSMGGSAGGVSGAGALSLAQLTAGLQGHHHLGSTASLLPSSQSQLTSSSSVSQQQLNDLQTMQVMQSLQHQRVAAAAAAAGAASHHPLHAAHAGPHHPAFHPTNNKAFLHFNEDLFGGLKPEQLIPTRSLLGPTTSSTPSTSLQLTSAHLPTDSNTLLQMETARKTLSGSPVSSEESGVPLKKRKVLLL
ncbi:hypothetical protein Vafri_15378 [Volvox africanus]|uniref:BHLH domain-containing protein n=1 Tax=Volvox africanus TaxID=51714 RepID=A0A8J4F8K9_9CHLO|nr:hypothetical protein Vafri_15378 [Volvox africanus]